MGQVEGFKVCYYCFLGVLRGLVCCENYGFLNCDSNKTYLLIGLKGMTFVMLLA